MKSKGMKALCLAAIVGSSTVLTGCMGHMAANKLVTKFNLSVIDNKYGRAGVFILISPIYGLATTADLIIFNSIEFWTGTNPITGATPPLTETPVDTWLKVNPDLDPRLTERTQQVIEKVEVTSMTDQQVEMTLTYEDGAVFEMVAIKQGEQIHLYMENQLLGHTDLARMNDALALR